jgi:hypothetical protein
MRYSPKARHCPESSAQALVRATSPLECPNSVVRADNAVKSGDSEHLLLPVGEAAPPTLATALAASASAFVSLASARNSVVGWSADDVLVPVVCRAEPRCQRIAAVLEHWTAE